MNPLVVSIIIVSILVVGFLVMKKFGGGVDPKVVKEAIELYKETLSAHNTELSGPLVNAEKENIRKRHRIELQDLRNSIRKNSGISVESSKKGNTRGIRWSVYVKDQLPQDIKWTFVRN